MRSLPLRLLTFLSLVAILGSVLYYALPVNFIGLAIIVALAASGAALLPLSKEAIALPPNEPTKTEHIVLLGIALLSLGAWWNAIVHVVITEAVRSPWGLVDPFSLAAIGIAFFASLVLLARQQRFALPLFGTVLFSGVAMAAAIYPLGFGFDPFLHRATVAHIAEFGTITPKPLYYIGQYAIELVLMIIARLPLGLVDRLLLPILAATMLSASAWYGLADRVPRRVIVAGLLLLPLGAFISTTPQGIAYVFALSAVFLSLRSSLSLGLPALLALAAMLTHPLAGIPAVLFVAATIVGKHIRASFAPLLLAVTGVTAILAIPLVFALQAARSGMSLAINFGNIFDASRWHDLLLTSFLRNNFSTPFDALYLVVDNLFLIVVILAVLSVVFLRDDIKRSQLLLLPLVFAAAMFVNFLTLSIVFDFDFLISYERQDYALRAITMAQLFLLPYLCLAIGKLDVALAKKPLALHAGAFALLAFIGTANVYGAYPRHDNYSRSAGFNVSQADFDAVYAIANKAGTEDYIVLSNQTTAAAAVEAFGFAKYYHTDIFYYPIPTGGPLYQQYLEMVNEAPTRERMIKAMDIAGVNTAFFTVSDYWWQAEQIVENAKREADDWFAVDNGQVTVFIFHR